MRRLEMGLRAIDATPVGLGDSSPGLPRVARSSQPWAGGCNPVGIEPETAVATLTAPSSGLFE